MKMLKETRVFACRAPLAAALMAMAVAVQAQENPNKQPNQGNQGQQNRSDQARQTQGGEKKEQNFLTEALKGNYLEVKVGNTAQEKTSNAEVKRFAQRLVRDHGEAYNKLKDIAQKQGVTWTEQIDEKCQAVLDQLQSKSGEEFDKEFARLMVKSHAMGIAKYQKCSREGDNAELKSFAQQTLPTLRQHFTEAKQLARTVGLDDAAIASLTREGEDAAGAPGTGSEVGGEAGKKDNERIDKSKDNPNPNQPNEPNQPNRPNQP
jgi:putative membrane protein